MSVWFSKDISDVTALTKNLGGMADHLEIKITEIGEDFLVASMPVTEKTKQPFGLLNGGASCVLAETLGSVASNMTLDPKLFYAVGLDINANHLRAVKEGLLKAIARPIHIGRQTHVWEIQIFDQFEKMSCISRLTMMVCPRSH